MNRLVTTYGDGVKEGRGGNPSVFLNKLCDRVLRSGVFKGLKAWSRVFSEFIAVQVPAMQGAGLILHHYSPNKSITTSVKKQCLTK